MSNSLVPFAVTLAVAWGSVVFTGVMYAVTLPAPATPVEPSPEPRPEPSPLPSPPEVKVAEVRNPTPPPIPPPPPITGMPTITNPVVTPPPPPPPPTSARGLPDRVSWNTGDLLVLVAPTPDQEHVWGALNTEVAKLAAVKDRLVGGEVFVVGRGALWRWSAWAGGGKSRPGEVHAEGESAATAFARTFDLVAADRRAILTARGRDCRTVVVWHSPFAPAEPLRVGFPDSFLLWTGKEQDAQRANNALKVMFPAPLGILPLGPELHDLGGTVLDLLPPAPNGAP